MCGEGESKIARQNFICHLHQLFSAKQVSLQKVWHPNTEPSVLSTSQTHSSRTISSHVELPARKDGVSDLTKADGQTDGVVC